MKPKNFLLFAIGSTIATSAFVAYIGHEHTRRTDDLIERIESAPLYQTEAIVIPAVKQRYVVSDLNGDGLADAIYVTINSEDPWAMHHRMDIYRKGDSDFEKILKEAESVQIENDVEVKNEH